MDTVFESHEGFNIEVSSSVVSLGKQVVERSEIQEPVQDRGRFVYNMIRAPMCDYLMAFVHKLRELNSPEMMNRVLENFSASMASDVNGASGSARAPRSSLRFGQQRGRGEGARVAWVEYDFCETFLLTFARGLACGALPFAACRSSATRQHARCCSRQHSFSR